MPTILENNTACVGCSACKASCPQNCIDMKMDEEGFLFPTIDMPLCILCDKCESVCPVISPKSYFPNNKAYFGWHKNAEVRYNSSSGGAFPALANRILNDGGIVFGAVFDATNKRVVHTNTNTDNVDLKRIQKSKYVESALLDTFREAKAHLKNNRKVLFCGTPCQIAGLISYIGENDNLLTCDLVCHGVPSGGFFKEHLEYIERKYLKQVTNVDFRSKERGWTGRYYGLNITLSKGNNTSTTFIPAKFDSFFGGYLLYDLILRKSCYKCDFVEKHISDLTLADFWQYAKLDPKLNDEKGISLIIANSQKGELAIKNINNEFDLRELDMEYANYVFNRRDYQPLLGKRNQFYMLAARIGFEKAARETYFKRQNFEYAKYRLKEFIKRLINWQATN